MSDKTHPPKVDLYMPLPADGETLGQLQYSHALLWILNP